jgi:hypothetical protein
MSLSISEFWFSRISEISFFFAQGGENFYLAVFFGGEVVKHR